jgi:hypothetical protein
MAIEGLTNDPLGLHQIAPLLAAAALLAFFSGPLARTLVANATPQRRALLPFARSATRDRGVALHGKRQRISIALIEGHCLVAERIGPNGCRRTSRRPIGARV